MMRKMKFNVDNHHIIPIDSDQELSKEEPKTELPPKEEVEKEISLLTDKDISPDVKPIIAKNIGLQLVNRNGKIYYRRPPERLTGHALESALKFAEINHANRGKSGNIILKDGKVQNKVAFVSSKEMKGLRFAKPLTEEEKIKALVEKK
jgi:hypothetical protein